MPRGRLPTPASGSSAGSVVHSSRSTLHMPASRAPLRPRVAAVLVELPAVLLVRSVCERRLAGGEYGGARQGAEHEGELRCRGASVWAAILRTVVPVAVLRGVGG